MLSAALRVSSSSGMLHMATLQAFPFSCRYPVTTETRRHLQQCRSSSIIMLNDASYSGKVLVGLRIANAR